jgi:serine protease Do
MFNNRTNFGKYIFVLLIASLSALGGYNYSIKNSKKQAITIAQSNNYAERTISVNTNNTNLIEEEIIKGQYSKALLPNFINASRTTTPAVVNIKAVYQGKVESATTLEDLLKEFFGADPFAFRSPHKNSPKSQKQTQSYTSIGSGVIVSEDGYIVTNEHVIAKADNIEVTLDNNQKYKAELIGQDPDTDLALLKIEARDLPYLRFGNSDNIEVGEWVLAVGNPFGLTSTVTQGIVSAKARNLENIPSNSITRLNSFIQTDAAINQGNSGGPLVNLDGELIGINTIIATPTGSFAGYAFAIPSIIVKKVFEDLKAYGYVDKGMLGVNVLGVDQILNSENNAYNEKYDLNSIKDYLLKNKILSGACILDFSQDSSAYKAGLRKKDIIVAVNDMPVKSAHQLQEVISRFNSGEKVMITYYRDGKKNSTLISIGNSSINKIKIIRKQNEVHLEGGIFTELDETTKTKLKTNTGIYLKSLSKGKLQNSGIKPGSVITKINKKEIIDLNDFVKTIRQSEEGPILIEGISAEGKEFYCVFKVT